MRLPLRAGELLVAASGNRAGTIPLLLACWSLGVPVLMADVGTPLPDLLELADRFGASAVAAGRGLAEGYAGGRRSTTTWRCSRPRRSGRRRSTTPRF